MAQPQENSLDLDNLVIEDCLADDDEPLPLTTAAVWQSFQCHLWQGLIRNVDATVDNDATPGNSAGDTVVAESIAPKELEKDIKEEHAAADTAVVEESSTPVQSPQEKEDEKPAAASEENAPSLPLADATAATDTPDEKLPLESDTLIPNGEIVSTEESVGIVTETAIEAVAVSEGQSVVHVTHEKVPETTTASVQESSDPQENDAKQPTNAAADMETVEANKEVAASNENGEKQQQQQADPESAVNGDSDTGKPLNGKDDDDDNDSHDGTDPLEKQEQACQRRMRREEIFSRLYRPSEQERQEVANLAVLRPRRSGLMRWAVRSRVISNSNNAYTAEAFETLVHPSSNAVEEDGPSRLPSLVMRRGPCLWRSGTKEQSSPAEAVECEVVVLTEGLLVIHTVLEQKPEMPPQVTAIQQQSLSRAVLWSNVIRLQPYNRELESLSWQLRIQSSESTDDDDEFWTFDCATQPHQQQWLDAVGQLLVQFHQRNDDQDDTISCWGWQYRHVFAPAFTMAVTGIADNQRPPKALLSKLDRYNGYAPIHYAVRCRQEQAVSILLRIGADPNLPDADGQTPVDYAFLDSVPQSIIDRLEERGGNVKDRKMQTGALFSQVAVVDEKRKNEKQARELEQQKEAEAAQHQMAENLRLLQERGDKIDELGNKASEMNEGAQEFRSMAKQLKDKMKQKSRWVPSWKKKDAT